MTADCTELLPEDLRRDLEAMMREGRWGTVELSVKGGEIEAWKFILMGRRGAPAHFNNREPAPTT